MLMVRIRVYDGKGKQAGELEVPAASVQVWLNGKEDPDSEALADIRDIVDPEHENENYDWDIWAKPVEVKEDLGGEGDGLMMIG